jgi:hypothetical protein
VVISSRQFHSVLDRNCTTTWYVFPLIVTISRKHCSKCLDISFCFNHLSLFSVTISSSIPSFMRIHAATNFALSGFSFMAFCRISSMFLLSFYSPRLALESISFGVSLLICSFVMSLLSSIICLRCSCSLISVSI